MVNKIEHREQLLNDIVKMLVDYDRYVEDKHSMLIHEAKQMVSATSLRIQEKPKDLHVEYWKYQTNPMIRNIADRIVGYILNNTKEND